MPFARTLKLFSLLLSVAFLITLLSACTSPDDDSDDGDNGGGGGGPVVDEEDLNGIFLKIDGKTHYLGNADVYRYSPSNQRQLTASYAGSASFHGTKLNYASVTVSNTIPADSVQTCGTANTNAGIKLEFGSTADGWGGTYNATACQIKLEHMSQRGGIEGVIVSATLSNGTKSFAIENAKFRVFRYTGYAGEAPAVTPTSDFLATLQIDSGSFELGAGQHFRLSKELGVGGAPVFGTPTTDGNAQISGNASAALSMSVSGGSTGACGTASRNVQVSLGTYQSEMTYSGTGAGAACSLVVEGQGNGAILGTYTGTLIATDNILPLAKRRIKVRGAFRNYSLGVPLASANETLPADTLGMTFNVGTNGSWHFPVNGKYRAGISGVPTKIGTTNFSVSFQRGRNTRSELSLILRYVPDSVGTYACGSVVPGTLPSAGYKTTLWATVSDTAWAGMNYNAMAEVPSSSCSITVSTYSASRIEGTYTATLVANGAKNLLPDGDTTLTVSGSFRSSGLP
jgi:hypothetical protein